MLVLYPRSLTGASAVDKNHGAEAGPMVEADGGEEQNDGARGWISGNPEVGRTWVRKLLQESQEGQACRESGET